MVVFTQQLHQISTTSVRPDSLYQVLDEYWLCGHRLLDRGKPQN